MCSPLETNKQSDEERSIYRSTSKQSEQAKVLCIKVYAESKAKVLDGQKNIEPIDIYNLDFAVNS